MQITNADALPEISDSKSPTSKDILTVQQRREQYRKKLETHQSGKGLRLKDFCLRKRSYFRTLDVIPRRKRAEDTDLMCRYYNADQYGSYDDMGIYRDQRQEGDFAYAIPIISGHTDQAWIQIFKVHPQYTVGSNDKNDATLKLVGQMCEELGVEELDRVLEPKAHSDIYNMLLGGESYGFLGWEPNKVSPRIAKRPKYEELEVDLPGKRECADCKEIVPADQAACTHCQSTNIVETPGGKGKQNNLTGYDEVQLGENAWHLPHMLATQRDMSALEPEDSTFLIEYSYLDKHVAEWMYQSEVEPSREGLPVEMLLRFDLERATNQTDAIVGSSRLAPPGREGMFGGGNQTTSSPGRKQPQERHYWEPSEYGQFRCDVDEQLPDGKVIPAGTLLGDYFPKGVYILFVGDSIMEIKECVRRRKVTLVRYGRIAGTNSGAGFKKAIPLQDAGNDNFNLTQTIKHTVGHPLTIINGQFVSELPAAGNVLKITKAGVTDVRMAVDQKPGQTMNNNDGAQETIEGAMQFILGTNTVGAGVVGAPDARAAGTATGIAAMQEQAAGRQSGPVDQRILRDKELIVQLLENIQEYSTREQKEALAKRFGKDVAKAFFNTNIRQAFKVGIKANTDMPKSMALTQANFLAFSQAAAQILQSAQGNPWIMEFLSEMATSMGFPFSVGEGRNDRREAEYRLDLLNDIEAFLRESEPELFNNSVAFAARMYEEIAKLCNPLIQGSDIGPDGQPINPAAPADTGIPRIFMQVHPSFMDVYKDAIFGEQAKGWTDAHKLCVIQMWLDHYKASLSQEVVMGQMQAAMQQSLNPQPDPEAEKLKADEEAARGEDSAEAAHQRALELEDRKSATGESGKDADLERELVKQGAANEAALALEQSRQANA